MTTVELTLPANLPSHNKTGVKRFGLTLFSVGMLFLLFSFTSVTSINPILFFVLSFGIGSTGALIYFFAQLNESLPGVKKNRLQFLNIASRGWGAWMLGIFFTGF